MCKNVSCTEETIGFPDGAEFNQVRHDEETNCHDCGTPPKGFHHPGCDGERCPRCRGQLIGCGCLDEEGE